MDRVAGGSSSKEPLVEEPEDVGSFVAVEPKRTAVRVCSKTCDPAIELPEEILSEIGKYLDETDQFQMRVAFGNRLCTRLSTTLDLRRLADTEPEVLMGFLENYPSIECMALDVRTLSTERADVLTNRLARNSRIFTKLMLTNSNAGGHFSSLRSLENLLGELQELDLRAYPLEPEDLSFLQSLENLKRLGLSRNRTIREGGLHHLEGVKALRELDLSKSLFGDQNLSFLEKLKKLRKLNLSRNPRMLSAIRSLKRVENLRELYLRKCGLEHKDLSSFKNLIKLEKLSLSGNPQIKGEGLCDLQALKSLRELYLRKCGLGHEDLSFFKSLKNLIKLEKVNLSGNPLGGEGLSDLQELEGLRELNLRLCSITDEQLVFLEVLKKVEKLNLSGNPLRYAPFNSLEKLAGLRELILKDCCIESLFSPAPVTRRLFNLKLEKLDLSRNDREIRNLYFLAALRNLRYLKLGDTFVNPREIEPLRVKVITKRLKIVGGPGFLTLISKEEFYSQLRRETMAFTIALGTLILFMLYLQTMV